MRRDLAIDALRGLAIWSMVSLHFADGTWAAEPTHSFPYMDGMSAFVLLSGLVLGIVHRRWTQRFSLRYSLTRLAQRIAVLYVCQAVIGLIAVWVASAMTGREFREIAVLPYRPDVGSKIEWALTLRYLPSGGNILLMYLIMMVIAVGAIALLVRGLWPVVAAASIALYVASHLWPASWMMIHSAPDWYGIQNWAAWQIVFMLALVVGWQWETWRMPERIDNALPVLIAVSVAVAFTIEDVIRSPDVLPDAEFLIDKVRLGPIRVVVAFLVMTTLYGVLTRVLRWTRRDVLRPLVSTGARSLDAYVIQATCLLTIPAVLIERPWSQGLAVGLALGVYAVCWAWAEARTRFGIDKLHRLPVRAAHAASTRVRRAERVS
ncbi:OpgC domain-containing protein [Gordonia sp. HY002]|uniref:OpgC domain-containing protein n=1 Tax=Gordonia zhenghanii TaxID=2911516 RepID=UPI001EF15CAE|nr:OpgC domain-containing protein [Gordonia zhenghanii]MCF8569384.1 OpgC domain-containing protein [Gordonia zhenghanii]MCF8603611.1 OpgC domain-containing protein [Gordonia zhenghanii]